MPPPGREALAVEEGRAHAHGGAEAPHHAHGHSHSHGSVRLRRPGDSEPAGGDYDAAHDRVHSGGYVNGGMRAAMLGFPGGCKRRHASRRTRLSCAPATRLPHASATRPARQGLTPPALRIALRSLARRRPGERAQPHPGHPRRAHQRRQRPDGRSRPRRGGGPHGPGGPAGGRCVHGVGRVVRRGPAWGREKRPRRAVLAPALPRLKPTHVRRRNLGARGRGMRGFLRVIRRSSPRARPGADGSWRAGYRRTRRRRRWWRSWRWRSST